MRIVHARKRVFDRDNAFEHKFTLLVWVLSALKWKEHGGEIVLYTDNITLEEIKKFGFETIYDEINTTYLEDKEVCKGIDFKCYWAMPKLLALKHEVLDLGNDVVISDMDVVPMSDLSRLWTNSDIAVWSNKEFAEIRTIYPKLYELSLPKNYKLPKWFTGFAKPLNTGIIHIRNKEIVDLFLNEAIKMSIDNHNEHNNSNCQTMCNVEQRLLGEIVQHKGLSYSVMQPINEELFNRNGFHTHGYKAKISNNSGKDWHCSILKLIEQCDANIYNKLIEHEWFKEEKEKIENKEYTFNEKLHVYYREARQ